MRSIATAGLAVFLTAPVAFAQEGGSVAVNQRQAMLEKQSVEIAARVPLETPLKGAPYSGDTIVESSQTLADGNHINHKSTGRVYRDGEGRVRREEDRDVTITSANGLMTNHITSIAIVDPVAGYSYSLNPEQKIAWRTPIGTSKELLDKAQAARLKVRAEVQSSQQTPMTEEQKVQMAEQIAKLKAEMEKMTATNDGKPNALAVARGGGRVGVAYVNDTPLEHATIDGLAVEGHKTSETIPAGKIGNDLPITITSEEWTSTDLKVLVLTKHNDPRTGESSYRLANVVRAEPDPSFFIVPPEYTVKDTGIRRNHE